MLRASRFLYMALSCGVALCLYSQASALKPRILPTKPTEAIVPPGHDRRHVEVKFLDGLEIATTALHTPVSGKGEALSSPVALDVLADIAAAGGTWKRMTGTWSEKIDVLVANAEHNLDRDIADLNNYFILTVPHDVKAEEWLDDLNSLPEVEIALAMPTPGALPTPPDLQPQQGYIFAPPAGIGAADVWGLPGGTGAPTIGDPVSLCDFEGDFSRTHQDLPPITELIPPGAEPWYGGAYHGTAILGMLVSMDNGWGTTGIAHGASGYFAPAWLDSSFQMGTAMTYAMTVLDPGSVFLLELQIQGPNWVSGQIGMVPVEWWPAYYNVILTAVGNGFHVIEAGANGEENLDDPIFNTGHAPFAPGNNSGAIMVGAGAAGLADVDRSRVSCGWWGSNWGSRIDIQGWGEGVVTTGNGDLYSAEGEDYYFGDTGPCAGGTSAASAVVAGVVTLYESMYESASGGVPLSPERMRNILKATGSPQQDGSRPASEQIGPRPSLVAALDSLPGPCLVDMTGDVNTDGLISSSDIITLVNYVFKSGPLPQPCEAAGDVGCDGNVTSSDIISLVNFVFKSGDEPCDVCTITPGTWTCP